MDNQDLTNLPPVQPPTDPAQVAASDNAMPASSGPTRGVDVAAFAPQIASDSDLIEKEWVERAKHIVEQTKNDPYMQAEQLAQFKSEYLKKRYNKQVDTNY